MNKIVPILTVGCLLLLLAFNWGLLPALPPIQQAPASSVAPVPPSPPVAVDPPAEAPISPAEAHNLFLTELEIEVHELINENRVSLGLKPLSLRSAVLLAPPAAVRVADHPAKIKRKIRSKSPEHRRLEKDPRSRQGRRRTAGGWAQNLGG